ncbi:PspC domain-containing protein [Candidatus Saccharibacteria bacterium]|nr:PspC domain-containing protein [Candidatus Saccharibacteria bacterium]
MTKKLYRSRSDKKIAGICGGLEDYTGLDATLWRIIFLLVALPGGISIFVYFIAWWLIPLEPTNS